MLRDLGDGFDQAAAGVHDVAASTLRTSRRAQETKRMRRTTVLGVDRRLDTAGTPANPSSRPPRVRPRHPGRGYLDIPDNLYYPE